jgi:DnaJ domain
MAGLSRVLGRPAVVGALGTNTARLTAEDDHLVFVSTYHQGLVAEFKQAIPAGARKWERERRAWLVDPAYGDTVARLCELYLGVKPTVPAISAGAGATPEPVVRLLVVEYLGGARLRPGGQVTAMGWVDGEWRVAFDVAVLRRFFEPGYSDTQVVAGETGDGPPPTLYALLGVVPGATGDELKVAFRRQALHLHPDRNREPDAAERFRQAKEAYDLLRDPLSRRKYDVGLAFEADAQAFEARDRKWFERTYAPDHTGYRAPVTNGVFLLRGTPRLGVFVAQEVLQREDIVSRDGAILVSSWPKDGDTFERRWVRPEAVAVP